jgi:Arc/MetJ-type ribon-helix-helix transcriptional regulator
VYERISKQSKEIELDLAEDVLSRIDHLIENGQYVSRGDAIRDILRRAIDDIDTPIE